ncbi:MAG: molybdenum cofactor guanylyltransferase [Bryobacteraceae bacterium]|nr:molybdenum cofactor guanylyltransferase [Bryobacteraceae bacterium]
MARGAFILTGGRSRRMGRDKALLEYQGRPLAAHVAAQAAAAAGRAWLVGPEALYGHLGYPCLAERFAGLGPLSGIEAALGSGLAEWCLVLGCDMPGADAASLRFLLAFAEQHSEDAAVTVGPDGRPEPLCAVYHARLAPLAERLLREGRLAVHDLLGSIRWAPFPAPHPRFAANINTPAEWAQWNR